jgi:hypothetical protein
MENQIQFIQTTPSQLSELINAGVKTQLEELKKELQGRSINDQLLTRKETCELLRIDSSTLWNWTNKGKVMAYGIGNKRYYKESEILESIKLLKK